jgi:hypothetical protein
VTVERWQRAAAINPGKHGPGDWKVTFNGTAPTHSELVFMLGMALIAEDRYPTRSGTMSGRYMLWVYIDLLITAKTPEAVIAVAEQCQGVTDSARRLKETA